MGESMNSESVERSSASHPHPDVTGRYYIPGFPIGEGKTDYEKYLRTLELLNLQKTPSETVSPDELLFQVTHQASELWMKLMLKELKALVSALNEDKLWVALRCLRLVHDCQRILIQHVDLIGSHISILEYGKIRLVLGQGSGMESPGFNWLLEMAPKLGEAYTQLLNRRQVTIRQIYTDYQNHLELHTLSEALMDFDDLFHKWRAHHMALVARTIGTESNSLKGLATQVLQKGVKTRFFPELLEIRSTLTNESGLAYGGQPLPN